MRRRLFWIAVGAVTLSAGPMTLGTITGQAAGPRGGTCTLNGTATIRPGLTLASRPQTATAVGRLSSCHSTDTSLSSGTLVTSAIGTGSCTNSVLTGTSTINWNNGKTTSFTFNLTGGPGVALIQGTVTRSTEPAIHRGDRVIADIAFGTSSGEKGNCVSGVPVTSSPFTGQGVLGNVD